MSKGRIYFKWNNEVKNQVDYNFNFKNDVVQNCSHIEFIDDYMETIPKNLIFVWIGDNVPEWAKFSMNQFKIVNPQYNIIFKHIIDWNSSIDEDVVYVKNRLHIKNSFWGSYFERPFIQKLVNIGSKVSNNVAISDIFRFHLMNRYGGIYLDTDTFPNKPFDDNLLKRNFFVEYTTDDGHIWQDIYFMGMKPGTISDQDYISEYFSNGDFDIYKIFKSPYFSYNKIDNINVKRYSNLKKLSDDFYDLKLEYKEFQFDKTSFIAHFNTMSWI